jgi:hypothetical protein
MLSVFNHILAVMTTIDTFYLLASITEFSFVESFHLTSLNYDKFFVYFLYPVHNVTLVCSIFLHVILAFERYLAGKDKIQNGMSSFGDLGRFFETA